MNEAAVVHCKLCSGAAKVFSILYSKWCVIVGGSLVQCKPARKVIAWLTGRCVPAAGHAQNCSSCSNDYEGLTASVTACSYIFGGLCSHCTVQGSAEDQRRCQFTVLGARLMATIWPLMKTATAQMHNEDVLTSSPSSALSSAALTVSTSALRLKSCVGLTPCCSGRGRVHCFNSCCMAAVPLPVRMSFNMRTNSGFRCRKTCISTIVLSTSAYARQDKHCAHFYKP